MLWEFRRVVDRCGQKWSEMPLWARRGVQVSLPCWERFGYMEEKELRQGTESEQSKEVEKYRVGFGEKMVLANSGK